MASQRAKAVLRDAQTGDGKLREKLEAAERKLADAERKSNHYKKLADQLDRQLEELKKSKWKLPRAKRTSTKGAFRRVIIPDTHGAKSDAVAIAAFLHDLKALGPSEVIMLGDHLDCGGFLAQHFTLGYVAETRVTFEQDVDATNQLLDAVQEACGNITYIEGNHERRIEKWCVDQSLRHGPDAEYLLKHFSTEAVLGLEQRGIPIVKQGRFYDGLTIPATIKRGHCHFTHGNRTGVHAAKAMVGDFGGNVVYGHTHRAASHITRSVNEGTIGAWSPGCLCELQHYWNHTQITGWSHGYGIQLVRPDGDFLHINCPIVDGKSFLIALVDKLT